MQVQWNWCCRIIQYANLQLNEESTNTFLTSRFESSGCTFENCFSGRRNAYLSLLGGPVVEGVGFEFTSYDHVPKHF